MSDTLPADFTVSPDLHATDWARLADIMARAPLRVRDPSGLAQAYRNSYAAAFARAGNTLIGGARAVSDGVYYATIYDVAVDPDWQGRGVGRALVQNLIERLPVEKIFLTSVPGKQGFYAKLGFLHQTNAMGWYAAPARAEAIERGVLLAPGDLASPRVLAISK
jgi:ribosomal protein S18 acetylase RimI-like enzyme